MTFGEALEMMAKGKVVARRSWPAFARNQGIFRTQSETGFPVLREIISSDHHLAWRPIKPRHLCVRLGSGRCAPSTDVFFVTPKSRNAILCLSTRTRHLHDIPSIQNTKARIALIVDLPHVWFRAACKAFPDRFVCMGHQSLHARRFERVEVAVKYATDEQLAQWRTLLRPGGELVKLSNDEIAELISTIMPKPAHPVAPDTL